MSRHQRYMLHSRRQPGVVRRCNQARLFNYPNYPKASKTHLRDHQTILKLHVLHVFEVAAPSWFLSARHEEGETVIGSWSVAEANFHGYSKMVKAIWTAEAIQATSGSGSAAGSGFVSIEEWSRRSQMVNWNRLHRNYIRFPSHPIPPIPSQLKHTTHVPRARMARPVLVAPSMARTAGATSAGADARPMDGLNHWVWEHG